MTASTLYRDYEYDYDNLIAPIEGNEWRRDGNTPSHTPAQGFSTDIGVERATKIGLIGTQQGRGLNCTPLVVPAGCMGGVLEISGSIPSGDARVNLAIYNDALNARPFEAEVTLGTSLTTRQLSCPTLGPGQYFAACETNHAGQQAKPVVWDIRYTPNFSTVSGSVVSRSFKRFRARALHGNLKTNWILNRFMNQSCFSRWLFEVTIPEGSPNTKCAVRTWIANNGQTLTGAVTFYVQGEAIERSTETVADATYSYNEFEVPRRAETMIIGFKNAIQTQFVASNNRGSFFVDAFFPADWEVRPVPPPANGRVCVVVGDSITMGAQATIAESQSWGAYFETRYPGLVVYDGAGGRWFLHIGADAATSAAYAQEIAKARPTDIVVQIGINDKLNNGTAGWTPATLEAAIDVWLDAVHAAIPGAMIHVIEPYITAGTIESTPVNGLSMAQLRTAWRNAGTDPTRAHYCHVKSATDADMPTTAFLQGDNFHLTTDGQAIGGAAIAAFVGV